MATFVYVFVNPSAVHITDDENGQSVKTRCGRRLKCFFYGEDSFLLGNCQRCGPPDDYADVREEMHKRLVEAYKKSKAREERIAKRISQK